MADEARPANEAVLPYHGRDLHQDDGRRQECPACLLFELGQRIVREEGGLLDDQLLEVSLTMPRPDGDGEVTVKVQVTPVLFITRSDRVHNFIWCPACRQEHAHGQGEGHRVAHCPPGSPFSRYGYQIRARGYQIQGRRYWYEVRESD